LYTARRVFGADTRNLTDIGIHRVGSGGGVFTHPTSNGPTLYGSTGSIVAHKPIVGIAG